MWCGFLQRVSWIRSTDTSPEPGPILIVIIQNARSAGHCVFQRGGFQPWRAQGEAGIRVELLWIRALCALLPGGQSPQILLGKQQRSLRGIIVFGGSLVITRWRGKKNLGIHLKETSNYECRNTRDSSPGEGAVLTTSWLLWTSNGMEVFLLYLRHFCAVLRKSINHFSKFCCKCYFFSRMCLCMLMYLGPSVGRKQQKWS